MNILKRKFKGSLTLIHSLVLGADILKNNFKAITFQGEHDPNYSTDFLFGDNNWAYDCYDNIADGFGVHPGIGVQPLSRLLNQGEDYLGYFIEMEPSQTISSIYIAAPGVEIYQYGFKLEGYVSVVDQVSDAYNEAYMC